MNSYAELIGSHFGERLHHICCVNSNHLLFEYTTFKENISLRIEVPESFPRKLPQVYVVGYEDNKKFYSHVESNGKICYLPTENILFDTGKPDQLFIECIQKALKVIDTWETDIMKNDLRKEFLSYWAITCKKKFASVKSYSEVRDSFEEWEVILSSKQNMLFRKNDNNKDKILTSVLGEYYKKDNFNSYDALYLPLRLSDDLIPPNPKHEFNIQSIKHLIDGNLRSSVKKQFKDWLNKPRRGPKRLREICIDKDYKFP
ncbi:E2/UBC family protein [Carnobacterium divergens]|uniref:E2/UBC family protein n=2 Tax=Carnobacterium divergens TaxID=2748 RepID=UPI001430A0CF|nr:E2/UBC family protein [Carnobacterium divergens]